MRVGGLKYKVLKSQHVTLHVLQISFRIRCAVHTANLNDKLQDRKTNNGYPRACVLKSPTLQLQEVSKGSATPS